MQHPSETVKSIERAMPREQTRGQHPECKKCARQADFTVVMATSSGTGYYDLCNEHLTKELENATFAAKVLAALIAERLPKAELQQQGKAEPSLYEHRGIIFI